jgi:hypothetical protein
MRKNICRAVQFANHQFIVACSTLLPQANITDEELP